MYPNFLLNPVTLPVINTEPSDALVPAGQTATFSVSALGEGTLSYQWIFGVTPLNDVSGEVTGSDSNSLAIINVLSSDATQNYTVEVSNSVGVSVTSVPATLSICEFACLVMVACNTLFYISKFLNLCALIKIN